LIIYRLSYSFDDLTPTGGEIVRDEIPLEYYLTGYTPPSAPRKGGGDSPGRGVLKEGGVY